MAEVPQPVDFDTRPPMPVDEYEMTVRRVNVGYDLVFTLTGCFLRALRQPDLELLVAGAGGGAEIERFLPDNPGWRLTGVDPSQNMLALAAGKADRLGVAGRTTLMQGGVQDLPDGPRFGAATCMFVLHFLPDAGKLALLQGIAARLRPGAPVLVATGARPEAGELGKDMLGAWQAYGESMGMPAAQMAAALERLTAAPDEMTTGETYVSLLREAGFRQASCYFSVLAGGLSAWIAR